MLELPWTDLGSWIWIREIRWSSWRSSALLLGKVYKEPKCSRAEIPRDTRRRFPLTSSVETSRSPTTSSTPYTLTVLLYYCLHRSAYLTFIKDFRRIIARFSSSLLRVGAQLSSTVARDHDQCTYACFLLPSTHCWPPRFATPSQKNDNTFMWLCLPCSRHSSIWRTIFRLAARSARTRYSFKP